MGHYTKSSLLDGENVVYETHLHWMIYSGCCLFAALAFVTAGITLFIALPALLLCWIRRRTSEFCVTSQRVLIKTGWISRKTIEMNLSKVESIEVAQGAFGRMLGYGTITVVGTGSTREVFSRITDPLGFRRAVQSQKA